jgi:hypothetical protein
VGECGDTNVSTKDWEKLAEATQRFVKAWGEAVTEQFKPFNEAVSRMQEQERKRRSTAGEDDG